MRKHADPTAKQRAIHRERLVAAVPVLGQGVTLLQVTVDLPPAGSTTVTKAVETNPLPPASDFLFLADTTGSMGPSIDDVKANAQLIINAIEGAGAADGRYAVANYRDTTATAACNYLDELDTDFTNSAGAIAAINTWSAGTTAEDGGCDLPESQLYALHQAATSARAHLAAGSGEVHHLVRRQPGP